MKVERIIMSINYLMGKQQYGAARAIIVNEWARVTEKRHYQMLSGEAKELVKVILMEKERGIFNALSDNDKRILNLLNQAVRDVQLPYAKKIFFEHKELLINSHAQQWLTSDARFLCLAWERNA